MSETETVETGRKRFPYISGDAFVSDTDRAALRNLQKVPLLPMALRRFNEYTMDHLFYAWNSAEAVRCGPTQYATLHGLLREACSILQVPEPELYVHYNPFFNVFTAGMKKTFIVLQSGLVQSLTEEELLFVLGHELGHIKCGHLLYQELAYFLMIFFDELSRATLGLGPLAMSGLMMAFYEWLRQAHISADRAGLLTCQDQKVAFSTLMKIGAGSTQYNHEMDVNAFLEQARQHADATGGTAVAKSVLFVLGNYRLTHPQVVYRAKALDEWIASGAYERILSGDYPRDATGVHTLGPQIRCPRCEKLLSITVEHCPHCGADVDDKTAAVVVCGSCGTTLPPDAKFCMSCGASTEAPPPEEEV
jgi:Zn-dependent protease with chaperone function